MSLFKWMKNLLGIELENKKVIKWQILKKKEQNKKKERYIVISKTGDCERLKLKGI